MASIDRNNELSDSCLPDRQARGDESSTGEDLINNKFTFTKLMWIEKMKFNNLGLQL
ncbi:MAG: hypothetical protein JNK98_04390 [Chitinophagaceae bacterium]|nr:hypothetical protein [Chitinophagaceae bacterium]